MELVVNILILIVSIHYSFRNPTIFVCFHILYHTQFLGFIPTELLIGGVDYGSFTITMSMLLPLCIKGKWEREVDKITLCSICFITFFILYGFLKPVGDGTQPLLMGIKAGKSFLSYIFFFYLLLFRKHIDFRRVFDCILAISILFSILYVINFIGLRLVPTYYVKNDFIQCKYDSFLVFSIVILIYRGINNIKVIYFLPTIILLFLGICIGGYFSLMVTTALILLFTPLYKKAFSTKEILFFGCVFCFYLLVCYIIIEQTDWYNHLQQSQSNSLLSRERYNQFRWNLIKQHLYWGWGFLYKATSIMKSLSSIQYMETFSFIDSGYVDLFGRFGIMGTVLFLLYPAYLIIKSLPYRSLFPFTFFIFQLLCVNYTWAVFSFPMGIIVLALAYTYMITYMYNNLSNE